MKRSGGDVFEPYVLLKTLHVLLIATWLGMDFGTFISYSRMRDASLSIDTRKQMYRVFAFIDMGPRSSLVLMLTLGVALTYMGGWGFAGSGGRAFAIVVAILGIFWVAAMWHQYWVHEAPPGESRPGFHVRIQKVFRPLDIWLRVGLAGGLAVAAVVSLAGGEGPIYANWLSWKLILFAGIVMSGVGIRVFLPAVASAVADIFTKGSTPEREAALAAGSRRTIWFVYAIWVLIIAISWVAIAG
ncbi:MAG: hypothetical protein OXS29_01785 [bacterium]|nr:hypothetical protein [bacterium]MDE0288153.1 hypothetical protein [bacterium]MDE0437106.1 hypothetical protein [bacterium]